MYSSFFKELQYTLIYVREMLFFLLFLLYCSIPTAAQICQPLGTCSVGLTCIDGDCAIAVSPGGRCSNTGVPKRICTVGTSRCRFGTCTESAQGGPGEFNNCTTTEDCGLNEVCIDSLCQLVSSRTTAIELIILLIFLVLLSLAIVAILIFVRLRKRRNQI